MDTLPDTICYLNGHYSPLREARISVLDRGFIFGDGVYEVVPIYAGAPFRFEEHMARLNRSLAELRLENPHTLEQWRELVHTLVAHNPGLAQHQGVATDSVVYIQITRGVAVRDHVMPQGITPTVFAMLSPLKAQPEQARRDGVSCVTADDFRWAKGHIKSTSLLGAVLARQISADVNATETILLRDGFLTEASASNVWVVKNGHVLGAPRTHLVLEGIRYGVMGELCQQANIPFELRPISREELLNADEVLLTSATKEVLAVTRLDGQPVGTGRPGPVYQRLYEGYQRAKADSHKAHSTSLQNAVQPAPAVEESLITYPCLFPVKVMGPAHEGFIAEIIVIAQQHDSVFVKEMVQLRPSKSGTYVSLTLTINATSREQLDNLYRALTSHPQAQYVL